MENANGPEMDDVGRPEVRHSTDFPSVAVPKISASRQSTLGLTTPTRLLDGIGLFEAGPVNRGRIPRWRPLTGSSSVLHNFVSWAWFLGLSGLPQTCTTWIYREHVVSDNRGSYENRSYLR